MSYQEKRTIASLIAGLLILAAYGFYVFTTYQQGKIDFDNDLKFWASTMLIFIGIGIVITIVIQIIFHIIINIIGEIKQEEMEDPMIEDEMDKIITLKAEKNAYIVAGIGFVSAMIAVLLGQSASVMINIIFVSFYIGSLLEGVSELYFYRKGV